MSEQPIRVWLEPEYDYGRTGAWMLDWPGCFAWGDTRELALARVASAVRRHMLWLQGHGEDVAIPVGKGSDRLETVEEVSAVLTEAGYELNALFRAERRPVTTRELQTWERRMAFARDDLLDRVEQVRSLHSADEQPSEARDRRAAGAPTPRALDEVLRHVAVAEAWLTSRLESSFRFAADPDATMEDHLREVHDWTLGRIRELHQHDPGLARTDGKGEAWTLAKVLRRLLYHSLDHLGELDRRLATAGGRALGVELKRDAPLDIDALAELLRLSGLGHRAGDPERLRAMVDGASETVSAWSGTELIGFARMFWDGTTNGYISTVAVHPAWQDRGVGRRLMEALMEGRDDITFVLNARPGTEEFYGRLGFHPDPHLVVRPRVR